MSAEVENKIHSEMEAKADPNTSASATASEKKDVQEVAAAAANSKANDVKAELLALKAKLEMLMAAL